MDKLSRGPLKLAIVVSHPVQYYAPWFAYLATHLQAQVRVFFLWDLGVVSRLDHGFGREVRWDIDLLSGYDFEFVPNVARYPGTHHFHGLRNPGLIDALATWNPSAILLFGYRSWSHLRVLLSRRLRRIPLLFRGDSHLLAERCGLLYRGLKRLALRLLFRRFQAFLPVGQANAEYFLRHGVPRRRLFRAPHAVDNHRFFQAQPQAERDAQAWREELGIPTEDQIILFVGKFETKKQPLALINAFRSANLPEASLLLVGGGPLESEMRRAAAFHPSIHLVQFQNQSVVPRVYFAADVLVLPSCGPDETWGLVVNEAFCCGRPVIVSDEVGCHLDLVRHGENGLVFQAGDLKALIECLREALSLPARLKEWGENGRKRVADFSYQETTAGLANALSHALQRSHLS